MCLYIKFGKMVRCCSTIPRWFNADIFWPIFHSYVYRQGFRIFKIFESLKAAKEVLCLLCGALEKDRNALCSSQIKLIHNCIQLCFWCLLCCCHWFLPVIYNNNNSCFCTSKIHPVWPTFFFYLPSLYGLCRGDAILSVENSFHFHFFARIEITYK